VSTAVAGALGECVHVAWVFNFMRLAETAGWRSVFLGADISVEKIIAAAKRDQADLVGVSYRLTPETGERLLGELAETADELRTAGMRFVLAGTPPEAERARTAQEWLKLTYDTVGDDLHEAIHNQPGYYGIKAPSL